MDDPSGGGGSFFRHRAGTRLLCEGLFPRAPHPSRPTSQRQENLRVRAGGPGPPARVWVLGGLKCRRGGEPGRLLPLPPVPLLALPLDPPPLSFLLPIEAGRAWVTRGVVSSPPSPGSGGGGGGASSRPTAPAPLPGLAAPRRCGAPLLASFLKCLQIQKRFRNARLREPEDLG